jgi:drug/metabolite transporter (DMT)-like permease
MIQGIKILPLKMVSLIVSTAPIFTAIISYIFLKERMKLIELLLLMISFFGLITTIFG